MKFLRLLIALMLLPGVSQGERVYGPGDRTTVQNWISTAAPGDEYVIVAGSYTYSATAPLVINKAVTIFGVGWGDGGTVIEYHRDKTGSYTPMVRLTATGARFSNVEIRDDVANPNEASFCDGLIALEGTTQAVVDHVKFKTPPWKAARHFRITGRGAPYAAGHHLIFECDLGGNSYASYIQNGDDDWGDRSWGNPIPMGTVEMVVLEDNIFRRAASFDGDKGAMSTVRFNQFIDSYQHGHGAESGARHRGTRWVENYENDYQWVEVSDRISAVELRSGSGVVFNNRIIPHPGTGEPDNFVNVSNYRMQWFNAPWFYSDGKNWFDVAVFDDGAGTPGGAGDGVYETGTITSVVSDDSWIDSSKSGVWTENQWQNYTIRWIGPQALVAAAGSTGNTIVVDPDPGWAVDQWKEWGIRDLGNGWHNNITSNTSDTLYVSTSDNDWLPNFSVSPGDTFDIFLSNVIQSQTTAGLIDTGTRYNTSNGYPDLTGADYEIRKIRTVMDGIGRGVANVDELIGGAAAKPPAGGYVSEPGAIPWYEWGNTSTGAVGTRLATGSQNYGSIIRNVDIFDYDATFDGTGGVGVGTKAEMLAITPTTDKVGFWVTDEANWDKRDPGPDGQLYQWDGAAWVLYYTPLEYPHPWRATLSALPGAEASYNGRLRLDNTKRPIKADGTGRPYIFSN